MKPAAVPANEQERLSDLYDYKILDTLPEKEFDDITRIASQICQTPMSTVSIIDMDRQWFKSRVGMADAETSRDVSFCAHAILKPQELFIVNDARRDERFHDYPSVTGDPHVAFYAGVPLVSDAGFPLGTLCVFDNRPKELTQLQQDTLRALANQVVCLLELHKKKAELDKSHKELQEVNRELEKFAYVVAHDLKSPCNNLISLANILQQENAAQLDDSGKEILSLITNTSYSLKAMIDGILRHSQTAYALTDEKEHFSFDELMKEVLNMISVPEGVSVLYTGQEEKITAVRAALQQILLNLCSNAINYNDKEQGIVRVNFDSDEHYYRFTVADNGMGIAESEKERIFEPFRTLGYSDRYNRKGTGIGLNTVKSLVERLGGEIRVNSEIGVGTSFYVSVRK